MMKQDRYLTGIVIGIAALVVLALVLFLTRRTQVTYLSDDQPQNVVQNFVLALNKKEYQKAYTYLDGMKNKPDFDEFQQYFLSQDIELNKRSLQVGTATVTTDRAVVYCTLVYAGDGPFGSINRQQVTASLVLKDGKWGIIEMPYYWNYSWNDLNSIPAEKAPSGD
jgi:hypothetical protein